MLPLEIRRIKLSSDHVFVCMSVHLLLYEYVSVSLYVSAIRLCILQIISLQGYKSVSRVWTKPRGDHDDDDDNEDDHNRN